MEYLMTYGWSILIIAIVLAALFGLGVFSTSTFSNNACVPSPGFLCSGITFSTYTGGTTGDPYIMVTLGSSSAQWTNVYFAVVPAGQTLTDTSVANEYQTYDFLWWAVECGGSDSGTNFFATFSPGQTATSQINFCPTIVKGALHVGSTINGAIWAMYSTPTVSNALVKVGVFTAVATSNK
jgi:hypothetical protein